MHGGPLPKLPAEPITCTKTKTFAEHLVPNSDNSANDDFTSVSGTSVHPGKPANLTPGDDRSPLLVGHLIVGGAPTAIFVGTVVKIRKLS